MKKNTSRVDRTIEMGHRRGKVKGMFEFETRVNGSADLVMWH